MRVSAGEGIIYFVRGGCGNIFVFPRRSLVRTYARTDGRTSRNHNAASAHRMGGWGTEVSENCITRSIPWSIAIETTDNYLITSSTK